MSRRKNELIGRELDEVSRLVSKQITTMIRSCIYKRMVNRLQQSMQNYNQFDSIFHWLLENKYLAVNDLA